MALNVNAVQIFAAIQGLQGLSSEKLKISLSYKIYKIRQAIDKEIEVLSQLRNNILSKYHPTPISELESNSEFKKEFDEFLSQSVSLDVEKINLAELGDVNISVNDLSQIDFLIEK